MMAPASPASGARPLARLDSLTGFRFFAAWLVVQHHFTNFVVLWRWLRWLQRRWLTRPAAPVGVDVPEGRVV